MLASFKLLLLAEFGAWVLSCPEAASRLGACLASNAGAFYKLAWAAVREVPVQCELCGRWRLLPAFVDAGMLPECVVRVQILRPRRRRDVIVRELPLDDVRAVASSRGRNLRTRVRAAPGTAG